MSRIIIGVDDSDRSADAIALGGAFARDSGAAVTVAHAYPWHHTRFAGTHEANEFLLEESEATLATMSEPLRDLRGLETRGLRESSPARALHALADELEAGLIVVGSSHLGRLGRVLPGSTSERLLHGAPCAVAIAPHGYRDTLHSLDTIACGWDGSLESESALDAAEALARRSSASLRVIRIFQPTAYAYPPSLGVAYAGFDRDAHDAAERELAERVSKVAPGVETEGELHEGLVAKVLGDVSHTVDLMVLGSRGYGPLEAVLLGGVSGQVVRDAGCAVIVVTNGSRRPLTSVFEAGATAMR